MDLAKQGVYALSLSPAQLANLSFLKVEGNVTATTFYEVEGLPSATGQSSTLKLTRTYPSAEEMQNSLDENGRFRVRVDFTIAKDAPDGYYTVHDFLPAGLTYIETQQNSETPSNCWQVLAADKEIAFSAYKSGDKAVSGWFAYYVRATGGGSYKAESAYISHSLLDGVYAKSNEQQIALK